MKKLIVIIIVALFAFGADVVSAQSTTRAVASTSLNVRKEKSNTSDILGTIQAGQDMEVVVVEDGWAQINYFGQPAYVLAEYITTGTSNDNVRSQPNAPVYAAESEARNGGLTKSINNNDNQEEFVKGFRPRNSYSINYLGRFEKAAAVNMDLRISYVDFGGSYTVSGGADGWNAYVGVQDGYNFSKNFFIDAALGFIYSHSTIKYKEYKGQEVDYIFNKPHYRDVYETKEIKSGGFGLFLTPRLGLVLGGGFGINIGYMMCAPKFKFDGFFDNGGVVLGLIFAN